MIELLIVVAIIAILAAIAVPNMLEAQTRSKVSRVRADLRTLATAIEAYTVDNNHPMFDGAPGAEHRGWVNSYKQMTTPVAYLSSILADPFQDHSITDPSAPGQTHHIDYPGKTIHSYDYASSSWHGLGTDPASGQLWLNKMGVSSWKIGSCGPDKLFVVAGVSSDLTYGFGDKYDPTNGTVSIGDVYRTQARID